MDEPPSRKKRARRSDSPDGDDKKRGRPRVEKQDESAADRRRTQIRMAQRAYRQRKECTLDELRKRVSDLSNTVELMNKIFVECRDRLYASDLPQVNMMDLHGVSIEFETLLKDARNPDESACETSKSTNKDSMTSISTEMHNANVPKAKNVPSWLDQSVVASSVKPRWSGLMDVGLGYTMFMPERENVSSTVNDLLPSTESEDIVRSHEDAQLPPLETFGDVPDFRIPGSLSPVLTYSFQETSIARRIHRACVEAAYHLVHDPRRRPVDFERIFRLSLLGRDRTKIVTGLKSVLNRGPHEDLDFWQAPLIHIGGSGTHYPRRDPFGNLLPKKQSVNFGIIGPQQLALLENAARDNISIDMTVELAGFEGEWFDSHDVQGYLEEKGIFIDPTASFAEADIITWPHSSSTASTVSSYGNPQTSIASQERCTPLTDTQVKKLIDEANADFSQWDDYSNMQLTAVGYSDAQSGSWMNFIQPGQSIINTTSQPNPGTIWDLDSMDFSRDKSSAAFSWDSLPQTPQPQRKSVIIDVSKFVKVMTFTGVCLGRGPGFRRRDVDRALAISSFDAF